MSNHFEIRSVSVGAPAHLFGKVHYVYYLLPLVVETLLNEMLHAPQVTSCVQVLGPKVFINC